MTKPFAYLMFCALLFAALPAAAAERETRGMFPRPTLEDQKYYTCQEDKQCMTVTLPCGRVAVVNNTYREEVQGWSDFVSPRYQCLATVSKQKAENIRCEKNLCQADIEQISSAVPDTPKARNVGYCETIDDCAIVLGPCYKKLAVNKDYKESLQKDYDKARDMHMEKCFFPDHRTVERLHCVENTCKADLKIPDQTHWSKPVDMKNPVPVE